MNKKINLFTHKDIMDASFIDCTSTEFSFSNIEKNEGNKIFEKENTNLFLRNIILRVTKNLRIKENLDLEKTKELYLVSSAHFDFAK